MYIVVIALDRLLYGVVVYVLFVIIVLNRLIMVIMFLWCRLFCLSGLRG